MEKEFLTLKNHSELKNKKLFVLDMDGTIYLEETVIPGAVEFINTLREQGKDYLFFTNNSSKDGTMYVEKLNRLGFYAPPEKIMTSGDVTINFLKTLRPGKTVYLSGTPALEKSFRENGIPLTDENPDIVVIGFDLTLTYEKIDKMCHYIRNGAEFIATHPDVNCPVEKGFLPDCGAMCAMIEASTGKSPKYLGKPQPETIEAILRVTGLHKEDIAVVGDRLATDIALGVYHGVTSILMLTGATSKEDLAASSIKPSYVFDSIMDLYKILKEGA
jgi:4-nitrophenyl phosphatase